jgi:hypothetical protein
MYRFLRPDPTKPRERRIARKRLEGVEVQRSGGLGRLARLNSEIFSLENQLSEELSRRTED